MKKILIAYSSKTGNTKKIAKAIQSGIEGSDSLDIKDIKNIEGYDLIVVGGWIDKGTFNVETLEFIKNIKDKNVAFFFTLGAAANSDHAKDCAEKITSIFEKNGNKVVESFYCQGAIDPKLIEFMKQLPEGHVMAPTPERVQRWKEAALHPDEKDLEDAIKFARSL